MADEQAVATPTKNCAGCNKPLKKAKKYYRNGAYYCNKNCFKNKAAPAAAEEKA